MKKRPPMVLIFRKINSQRSHKTTWLTIKIKGQYLKVASFTPIIYRLGLLKTLHHRTRWVCSPQALQEEESLIVAKLIRNCYPAKFINVHSRQNPKGDLIYKTKKKAAFFNLVFQGDHVPNNVRHNLSSEISEISPNADLRISEDHCEPTWI